MHPRPAPPRPACRVVDPVGVDHDEDCPPGCRQRHAFHYVRVRASRSTAPLARRAGRRLDLVVDLQAALRCVALGAAPGPRALSAADALPLWTERQRASEQLRSAPPQPARYPPACVCLAVCSCAHCCLLDAV